MKPVKSFLVEISTMLDWREHRLERIQNLMNEIVEVCDGGRCGEVVYSCAFQCLSDIIQDDRVSLYRMQAVQNRLLNLLLAVEVMLLRFCKSN